jgi:hypothetical protein
LHYFSQKAYKFLNEGHSFIFSYLPLGILSFGLRWHSYTQTQYANGWDAYFYLVQVRALETTGAMHSPDASLIYPFMRALLWLFHGDYIGMYHATAAFLAGLFVWVAAMMPRQRPTGWLLGAWCTFSPQLTYFAAQYPKNLLGLVFLLLFIYSLQRLPSKITQPAPLLLPLALLLLNYFGHRFTFGLAVLYGLLWVVWQGRGNMASIFSRQNVLIGMVALVIFLIAASTLPGLPRWSDLGRLSGLWNPSPHFAPFLFIQTFGTERLTGWWVAEIVLMVGWWAGAWGRVFLYDRKNSIETCFLSGIPLLILCSGLIFPFWEWSFTSFAYRAFMVWVLVCPFIWQPQWPQWRYYSATAVLIAAAFWSKCSYTPQRHDPDYTLFDRLTQQSTAHFKRLSPENTPELVICHNALAEYYTFTTGTDAMPWQPEYAIDTNRLWRIAGQVPTPAVRHYAQQSDASRVFDLAGHYTLLPETVWKRALQQAALDQDSAFLSAAHSWYNPYKMRPKWLK